MTTIPASTIVNVIPGVIAAGGTALDLTGMILDSGTRVPIGTVQSFVNLTGVQNYFGVGSKQAQIGAVYFAGYTNSLALPAQLSFTQYPVNAVSAYLRGGPLPALGAIQAVTGTLSVTIDGVLKSASINLATATSQANAASIIQSTLAIKGALVGSGTAAQGAAFVGTGTGTVLTVTNIVAGGLISVGDIVVGSGVPGGTTIVAQVSGTAGGNGVYTTSVATTSATVPLTTQSAFLNVSVWTTGTIGALNIVTGTGVTAFTQITSLGTGTGGTGTYLDSVAQYYPSQAVTINLPAVTYDSVTNAFIINSGSTGASSTITFASGPAAAPLLLTSATGAVLSQGAAAATPAAFMNALTQTFQNWATFFLDFDPDGGATGGPQKLLFAQWNATQNNRYAFICWDTDASPTLSTTATASLGNIIQTTGVPGTIMVYEPSDLFLAAFVSGSIASINFSALNGRTTMAFRTQGGLTSSVTNTNVASNLLANGYNYLGTYATANQQFQFFFNGSVSGPFTWIDSYINQIWLNNNFQLDLVQLLTQVNSIPYNNQGSALISAALSGTINQGLQFGAFRAGVTLSPLEIAEVNAAAGAVNVGTTLQTQGWYLFINMAGTPSTVRQARGSPPCTFFYVDGESVQAITLSSILLQ